MTIISVVIATLFVFYRLEILALVLPDSLSQPARNLAGLRSPLMWDATAVFTYATASTIYLYLPLDSGFCIGSRSHRRMAQTALFLTQPRLARFPTEWTALNTAIRIITPLIVMVMISVHSIVGWDFGMSLVPGWHIDRSSPLLRGGRGAFRTGHGRHRFVPRAAIYRLDEYIRLEHFDKLGKLMIVMTLTLASLYFADQLTVWYGANTGSSVGHACSHERPLCRSSMDHDHVDLCTAADQLNNTRLPHVAGRHAGDRPLHQYRHVHRADADSHPPLAHPRLTYNWSDYFPSWVELTIMAGSLSLAVLLYVLAIKFCSDHFHLGRKGRTVA